MKDSILSGRLGITVSKSFSPCCGEKLLKWSPRVIGDRNSCNLCGNVFHAVSSDSFHQSQYTGQCLETSGFLKEVKEIHFDQIWFAKGVFKDTDVCSAWLDSKAIPVYGVCEYDDFYFFKGLDVVPGSERVIYVTKGILGVVGLEKDAMSASDFTSGGSLNPSQGGVNEEETSEEESDDSLSGLVKAFFS